MAFLCRRAKGREPGSVYTYFGCCQPVAYKGHHWVRVTHIGMIRILMRSGFVEREPPLRLKKSLRPPDLPGTSDWWKWYEKHDDNEGVIPLSLESAKDVVPSWDGPENDLSGSVSVILTMTGWIMSESIGQALVEVDYLNPGSHVVVVQNRKSSFERTKALASHKNLKRVYSPNRGFAAACNTGAKHARGDWLLFTQADCRWGAHTVQEAIRLSNWSCRKTAVVGASGGYISADGAIKERGRNVGHFQMEPYHVDFVAGYWLLVRRDRFESVGGWDEGFFLFWEDPDLCLRLGLEGVPSIVDTALNIRHSRGSTIRTMYQREVKEEIRVASRRRFRRRWLK